MSAPAFPILISDNQAVAVTRGNLQYRIDRLKIGTAIPGGCSMCSFRLRAPIQVIPEFLDFNFELRLGHDSDVFWMGRIEDIIAHRGNDGEYWQVTAYGYGVNLDDQVYTSQNVQNTLTSTIASDAASTTRAPQIDARSITASGFTLANTAAVNLKLLTMAQVVNWAAKYGSATTFDAYIWHVYPDADGTVRFTFENRPATVGYKLRARDCEMIEFGLASGHLANRVVVQYADGGATAEVNDTALQGAGPTGWNVIKTLRAFAPEIPSSHSADATQWANALLARFKQKRMAARSIRLKRGAYLYDHQDQQVEPWRVRAGKLVQLTDIDPATNTGLSFTNSFLLQASEWDQDAQSLALTPEFRDLSPQELYAYVYGVIAGRHTVQAR